MKNLIVIIGTVLLGVIIFNMMVGSDENSLRNVSRKAMVNTIEFYNEAGSGA